MTRESAWIIPNDWELDGGDWENICITWPKSEQWRVMLRSLLFTLTRGRDWDAESGIIKDVQAIGWEIFDRNIYPGNCSQDCDECPDCPDCPDCPEINEDNCRAAGFLCGGGAEGDEEVSGQVVTEVYIDEDTGELVVEYGKCCTERFALSGVVGTDEPIPEGTYDPLLPPGESYSACGRASAVVDAIWAVATSMWDERDNPIVLQWVGHVETDAGLGNLSNTWIANGVMASASLDVLFSYDALFGDGAKAQFLCMLSTAFEASGGELSDDEWNAIYDSINGVWPVPEGNVHLYALKAIGRGTMSNVAKAGAVNTTAECPCGDEIGAGETTPDAEGWYLSENLADLFEIVNDADTWGIMNAVFTPTHDTYGSFLVLTTDKSEPAGALKRMDSDTADTGYTPPVHDVDVWGNTSGGLMSANQAFPFISHLSDAIRTSLAAQRDYGANNDGGTLGIDGIIIASPEGLGGQIHAASLWWQRADIVPSQIHIQEFRMVHNINSPSHA